MLYLVRHGRPLVTPGVPAEEWSLDPQHYDAVWELRNSDRLPARAAWFTSPESKAVETAQLLTDSGVGIVLELREHERGPTWLDDFEGAVRRAFSDPDVPAVADWEPLATCRDRVVPAVRRLVEVHADTDVVLVGHGTAWTLAVAGLTGNPPDLDRWASLGMPDLIVLDVPLR